MVKLWNLDISDFLENLTGHDAAVTCVALGDNEEFAVSGSDDCAVKVWSVNMSCVITNYTVRCVRVSATIRSCVILNADVNLTYLE